MKKTSKEAILIAKHTSDFLREYAPNHKTTSEHTLKSYEMALTLYISFLETVKAINFQTLTANCFNLKTIEDWLKWLSVERKCSNETINVRLSSLRVFLEYLATREITMRYLYVEANLIPLRKTTKKKVKGMSKEAVKTIMSVVNVKTKTGRRDLTLMIVLYATAVRIDELLSLKLKDVHLDVKKPYITVVGKGKKLRSLYLLPKAVAHLENYIKEFHRNSTHDTYLFYSRNKGTYGKLTQPAIDKQLKKHAKVAYELCLEVPLNLHAHIFRHAKASHWLEDGMNIVQISFLLGHERLETTMVYLDITIEEESKALATLEDENEQKTTKKWGTKDNNLLSLCGLKTLK